MLPSSVAVSGPWHTRQPMGGYVLPESSFIRTILLARSAARAGKILFVNPHFLTLSPSCTPRVGGVDVRYFF
jgi:hypothetical protein